MVKKEFIGISSEYDRLRIARIRLSKTGIELMGVETLDMPYPVTKIGDSASDTMGLTSDIDNLFGFEEGKNTSDDFLSFEDDSDSSSSVSSSVTGSPEDNFDMTRIDEDSDVVTDNEKLLADYFLKLGRRKLHVGIHIPFGKTTYQFVKNVDPGSMKKNEQVEFFSEKLRPIHNEEPLPDHYTWTKSSDDGCLIAYNRNDTNLINLVELAETYFSGKLIINERLPDESIWAGLVRANYRPEPDDITGIIAIGESSSRIMFMKGGRILNILPVIPEGENSDDILNTIFSKILFEIDKGELPKLNRVLLTRSARLSEKAKPYFEKQFDDVEVNYLSLDPDLVQYADELFDSPVYLQPYLSAIGAAWAASRANEKDFSHLTLLPAYVREKQRTLKIAWHGILILVLIALTPLYINNLYNTKAAELQQLEQDVRVIQQQIEERRPVATMTEDLIADQQVIQAEINRLLELSRYSQKWTEILTSLNEGVYQIPQLWLTSLRTSGDHINLTGISLTREQIPVLARLFTDANIQQVSETELRGQPVYSFALQANNFRQDIEEFLLELPEVEFDLESGIFHELDLSYAPEPDVVPERSFSPVTQQAADPLPVVIEETNSPQAPVQEEAAATDETARHRQIEADDMATTSQPPAGSHNEMPDVAEAETTKTPEYGLMGPEDHILTGAYTIVLYSIPNRTRAESEYRRLKDQGYKATLWQAEIEDGQFNWRIGVGLFETVPDALNAVLELPEPYRNDNFIIRIR